jgi:membrane protein involved in colicin uptake
MKLAHSLSLAIAISTFGAHTWATDADPHQARHPAGTASAPAAKAMPGKARMDSQMKAMHAMHDKMVAAKTPAERDALTAEHMKIMQDGMTMMNGMSPGAMGGTGAMKGDMTARHQAMEARMEMMQATMQMMMDRLPATPTK